MREQLLEHLRAIGFDVWRINERSRQLDPVGARMGLPWRGQSLLRSPVRWAHRVIPNCEADLVGFE